MEVFFEGDTWKTLTDVPRAPLADEVVVLRIYLKSNVKSAVVQKDDDILTPAEI